MELNKYTINIDRPLCKLWVGDNRKSIVYLGYPLKLTEYEYLVLKALWDNRGQVLSPERISEITGGKVEHIYVTYHVFGINRKSREIGDRSIVKNIAKNGYFLNEEM